MSNTANCTSLDIQDVASTSVDNVTLLLAPLLLLLLDKRGLGIVLGRLLICKLDTCAGLEGVLQEPGLDVED